MFLKEAIKRADALRLNTIGEEQKAVWLSDLDGQIAEMMGVSAPENTFPEDRELLMPAPHEEIYQLYLVAKTDYCNQEMELYANDISIYNAAMSDARAWYRRNNKPKDYGNWRTL